MNLNEIPRKMIMIEKIPCAKVSIQVLSESTFYLVLDWLRDSSSMISLTLSSDLFNSQNLQSISSDTIL